MPLLLQVWQFLLQVVQLFRRHPYPVIFHRNQYLFPSIPYEDTDLSLLPARLYAVGDCIFHHGLQYQLRYLFFTQRIIHLHLVLQLVLQTVFLYFQIAYHILHFPVQWHKGVLVLNAVAHQAAQGNDDVADIILFPVNQHPVHRIQGIVKEMGVNLRLERLHLRILLGNLLLVDLAYQGIDLVHHVVEGISQFTNLILPPVWHAHRKIPFLHLAHGP